MKGVLKGFKYISSIFGKLGMLSEKNTRKPTIKFSNEEKEEEIQIGVPTDVKHVAHIGRTDGPSTESPSWMKDFESDRPKSAPLDNKGQTEDSSRKTTSTDTELPKPSRRRHSVDSVAFENSDKSLSTKSKGGSRRRHKKVNSDGSVSVSKSSRSRRHRRKDSLSDQEGSSRSGFVTEDINSNGEVPERTPPTSPTPRNLPDIPKKTRRKKVKDEVNKIASKAKPKPKPKPRPSDDGVDAPTPPLPPAPPPTTTENTSCPFSEPGSVGTNSTTTTIICDNESCQISRKPSPSIVQEEKSDKSNIVGALDNSA